MDEQGAWIKSRRKKHLCLLTAALSAFLLFTTYPDILAVPFASCAETLSVKLMIGRSKEYRHCYEKEKNRLEIKL